MSRSVVAFVPDLMDRSKVSAAAPGARFVSRAADLPDAASAESVVVVDLMRPGVLEVLDQIPGEIVGFANHAERDLMAEAEVRGCHRVMARSAFFGQLGQLLGS